MSKVGWLSLNDTLLPSMPSLAYSSNYSTKSWATMEEGQDQQEHTSIWKMCELKKDWSCSLAVGTGREGI
jgi:hypothetical protein